MSFVKVNSRFFPSPPADGVRRLLSILNLSFFLITSIVIIVGTDRILASFPSHFPNRLSSCPSSHPLDSSLATLSRRSTPLGIPCFFLLSHRPSPLKSPSPFNDDPLELSPGLRGSFPAILFFFLFLIFSTFFFSISFCSAPRKGIFNDKHSFSFVLLF